jgi:3',5'-cyclic AMP phosphodiesterase CpdA
MKWAFVSCMCVGLCLAAGIGCPGEERLVLPPRESADTNLGALTLVARLVHISDSHLVDEESPARFAGAHKLTQSAWRPYESYSTQLLDGIIRTINRIHAGGRTIDFVMHTGDACDNAQSNELAWFIGVLDGWVIDPLSGPDDRTADARPEPRLDPHAAFQAQGLYRQATHGELPSIPWYVLVGNHDAYAIGVFPILALSEGRRVAPLPLAWRPGCRLPVVLDPVASTAYGRVTPADPGPPCLLETPQYVEPNAERAYFSKAEFVGGLFETRTTPPGHGFDEPGGATCYNVSPVPGLRLIGLDSTDRSPPAAGTLCQEGALSREQFAFLQAELAAAREQGELVIVASHHPTPTLRPEYGSEVSGGELVTLLSEHRNVVLHLAGHKHRNRVTDHGGYIEIETCSTLDLPQEGRLIEIWRDDVNDTVVVTYEMFSHIDDELPPLGEDPLRELREQARSLAMGDKDAATRQKRFDPSGEDPYGQPADRCGVFVLDRSARQLSLIASRRVGMVE